MSASAHNSGADELAAILQEIRERVGQRHSTESGEVTLPDLLPILHARDAAQGKVASIGRVNPRQGGLVNTVIQSLKRFVSRALDWHVREQVEFNQAAVSSVEAILYALEENNRVLGRLLGARAAEVRDLESHWIAWRSEWERKLAANETQFLRGLADLQGAYHHRATLIESNCRDMVAGQHRDFETALANNTLEVQRRLWADLERIKLEYQSLIHHELRLLRQKPYAPPAARTAAAADAWQGVTAYDGWAFAERFRGPVEYVKANQQFYLERFRGRRNIVDLGCGRGEFLELLKENGIAARGVDSDATCVAHCGEKGLQVSQGDLYTFLEAEPPGSLDAIFCCQVVEHLPRMRVYELIRLAQSRLARGGVLAVETPNPECLAIFATHFYLDPTHQHPLPPGLLAYYFTEAGFEVEVKRLQPAIESMPELASLPAEFREKFFGSLDYAVLGTSVS